MKNPMLHTRIKHIKLRHNFNVCEKIENDEIKLVYIPTIKQETNIFTKPLGNVDM
jgi:hypothetical protein